MQRLALDEARWRLGLCAAIKNGLMSKHVFTLIKSRAMKWRTRILKDYWIKELYCRQISTDNIRCIALGSLLSCPEEKLYQVSYLFINSFTK